MRRNQSSAILFALLLFLCGVATGVLAERYFSARVVNAKTAEDFRHQYLSEMKGKLNLTATQQARLEVILDETKAKYKSLRDGYRPDMLKVKQEQIDRVKSILTPAQVPAYEKLVAAREQRYKVQEERDRQEDARREAAHRAAAAHQ